MAGERPWASPGPPPWATPAERRRPPWWQGLGVRVALVALLILTDPARAARALAEPIREFREDADR
jgi:hypothetical protein